MSGETYMQVKKQQLELDMEQRTGWKLGKEYVKAVFCHPAYSTYTQSTGSLILSVGCWCFVAKHLFENPSAYASLALTEVSLLCPLAVWKEADPYPLPSRPWS